jgi:hypothetical protein
MGMTEPGERDYKIKKGRKLASERATKEFYNASKTDSGSMWCCTPLKDVKDNIIETGYMQSHCLIFCYIYAVKKKAFDWNARFILISGLNLLK